MNSTQISVNKKQGAIEMYNVQRAMGTSNLSQISKSLFGDRNHVNFVRQTLTEAGVYEGKPYRGRSGNGAPRPAAKTVATQSTYDKLKEAVQIVAATETELAAVTERLASAKSNVGLYKAALQEELSQL